MLSAIRARNTEAINQNNDSLLFPAAKAGDVCEIIRLHSVGANLNATDGRRLERTPLHYASQNGQLKAVEVLVSLGAKVDGIASHGLYTPLLYAASNGHVEVLRYLLNVGANPNACSDKGRTVLLNAVRCNQMNIICALIAEKADVNVSDHNGRTPLHKASKRGNWEVAQKLLLGGAKVNALTGSIFRHETALHAASFVGSLSTVSLLVTNGADLNTVTSRGQTALHRATYFSSNLEKSEEHVKVALYLIEKGANVQIYDADKQTPMHYTTRRDDKFIEVLTALLAGGANPSDVDRWGCMPLHYAAQGRDSMKMIKALLEKKVDVRGVNNNGQTPLHLAAMTGSAEGLKMLLEAGAQSDIDASDRDFEETPLCLAALYGNQETLDALIDAGSNLDLSGLVGTALHLALTSGRKAPMRAIRREKNNLVHSLVNAGANVNLPDRNGLTPLHIAAREGNVEAFKILYKAGANINAIDCSGRKPIDLSCSAEVRAALLEALPHE